MRVRYLDNALSLCISFSSKMDPADQNVTFFVALHLGSGPFGLEASPVSPSPGAHGNTTGIYLLQISKVNFAVMHLVHCPRENFCY